MRSIVRIFTPFLKIALGAALLATGNITAFGQQPVNDNCTGAFGSVINEDGSCSQVNSGTTVGATQSSALSCFFGTLNSVDVWYSFVATGTDATITFSSINPLVFFGITYYGFELYSGPDCVAPVTIGCDFSNTAIFYDPAIVATGLHPGETYYIKVISTRDLEFDLCIQVTGVILPVSMDKLKGTINGNDQAQLTWNTYSEQNNKGFEIQRSVNGSLFEKIGFVSSKAERGTSNQLTGYDFTDQHVAGGFVYYRLLQVDADGKSAYSNIVKLLKDQQEFALLAAPNPARNTITLSGYGTPGVGAMACLTDISGKILQQFPVTGHETVADISNLPRGMYLLQYRDEMHNHTIKMIKE